MNEERLEVIKHMYNNDENLHQFDIEWLIEQTEKVERYEKALKYYAKNEALRTPFQRETYGMPATNALKG